MQTIVNIIIALFGLGFLILVHEFGHFIVAKILGIKVEAFSIGFGPVIFRRQIGETEYRISLFLLVGGYVKIYGETSKEAEEVTHEAQRAMVNRPYWQQVAVVSAGVVMNFIFGILFCILIYLVGINLEAPIIGSFNADSLEWNTPILPQDKVISVNNIEVKGLDKYRVLTVYKERPLVIKLQNPQGQIYEVVVSDKKAKSTASPVLLPIIDEILPNSIMAQWGFKKNDQILELNQTKINSWQEFENFLLANYSKEVQVKVKRDNEGEKILKFYVKPQKSTFGIDPTKFMPAKICSVKKGSPAENAGITQFSSIISLNNKKISNRATLLQILHEVRNSKNIKIEFEDKEKNIKSSTIPFLESFNARPFLGITFCPFNFENNTFEALPEELTISGVKVGDKLIEINGKKIKALEELFKIKSDTKEVLTLKVQSPEGDIKIAKLPLEEEQTIFLGAAAKPATVFVYFPLFQAIHFGLKDAMEIINMTFWSLKALIVREVSPKELAGPVGIINISYKVLQKSFVHFLYILALISLNLAILNILPIPILDGSLIVLFTIEKLLRKKLSEKFVKTFEIAGFCILISLLLFTLKNDIFRLFGK